MVKLKTIMQNKKTLTIILLSMITVILIVLFLVLRPRETNTPSQKEAINDITYHVIEKDLKNTSWITETCYDGTTNMDANLYEIRFQKTSAYVSNKEYVNLVDEEKIEELIRCYEGFVSFYLGNDYRNIVGKQNTYRQAFANNFKSGTIYVGEKEYETLDDYCKEIEQWYVDNKIQLSAEGLTDKTLVYEDGLIYIRGKVKVKPFCQIDCEKVKELFDISLNETEPTEFIFEIGITKDNDTYKICTWNVL